MSRQPVRAPWFMIGLLTIMAVLVLTGCSGAGSRAGKDDAQRKPSEEGISDVEGEKEEVPDAPKEEKWHKIAEFTGDGSGDTGAFEIKTTEYWRVTMTHTEAGGSSTASLYRTGESPGTSPHHGQVIGSGEAPVSLNFAETGNFFLRVDGEGSWKIVVDEWEAIYAE